ncbi:phosphoinositide-3-kinase-interacting protein 1 isoform X2 [Pristis pectinata]|uniref:phosphoinositide-3-kinase-interacting protein 1 isoform X2 n=1 Tax=Pristis pectinata TaxID=685728 RepID=UPI00223D940B|nr:phosphoinositide-3-kinase-interacting protein 1 isoform X2 [Pristis pectinata]
MEAGGGAGPRGSGGGGGRGLPGLGRVALLLHLLTVVGAAPRPECITSNGTDLTGEQRITSGVNCANLMQSASLSEDVNHTTGEAETVKPGVSAAQVNDQVKLPSASEPDIQQPVGGISHPVRQSAEPKRDLGVPGQVLAIIMIAIIIVLGCGITLGYIYKRGRDLKKQREQQACEQEIQRIMLPLSAFSNPSCELDDEITLVMVTPQTHAGGSSEGDCPLAAAAGTPGA